MNNDSYPPDMKSEPLNSPLQPSTEHRMLGTHLKSLPPWMRWGGIGCGSLIVLLIFLMMSSTLGNLLSGWSNTPPPVQRTATAELLAPTGQPKLGGLIANFIREYGQPSSVSSPSDGFYDFNNILEVFTSQENHRVDSASFMNTNSNGWTSLASAIPACEKLIPSDAVYQRVVELYNPMSGVRTGTERVYFSPSLASLFKASNFTDEKGQITIPGIFAIAFHYVVANSPGIASIAKGAVYYGLKMNLKHSIEQSTLTDSTSPIADCNPQIGLERVQELK
jgi:hypothetical protein